MIKP
jgi:hypothetical protein